MTHKSNAMRLLDGAKIAYQPFEYDISDGLIDGVSVAKKLGQEPGRVFKTLVAREKDKKNYFVFIIPSDAALQLKKGARTAGVKGIEMLPLKELLPLTGYEHGGCSPVGMKKAFPTYIDESALLYDKIFVSAGIKGINMEISPEELAGYIAAEFSALI